jgi:16S rRNA (adenine1518-N6/adenine1519-N6)-dimethyltransferase
LGRRLGQHFLISEKILKRITAAVTRDAISSAVEIGPGQGALTRHLLQAGLDVTAVELDAQLAAGLDPDPKLRVIPGDVLTVDLGQWGGADAVLCGNLPYYITSPILEAALKVLPRFRRAVFLIQREPAERVTALPGSRDFGFLSVLVQVQAEARLLFGVPPGAFRPPPAVDSAVIELVPRAWPGLREPDGLIRFASQCFQHKRKNLRNNLMPYTQGWIEGQPEAALRGEQLGVPGIVSLFERWQSAKTHG